MDDIIDIDYASDDDGKRRLKIIITYFEDPKESYETIKKIYSLSPDFIRFCYKALGTKPGFKIRRHTYGFSNTPHTSWENFETKNDKQFLKDMIFELAFRMLQQVFGSFPLDNTYNYIKHANTALSRCRVCEILWKDDKYLMPDLEKAKIFFIWFIERYNGVELFTELYQYTSTKDDILTTIYYYNTIYALKYDFVTQKEALNSLNKLKQYEKNTTLISRKTRDKLEYDLYTKLYHLQK